MNKTKRGQGESDAVRNRKGAYGFDQLAESAHQQQEAKNKQQVVYAG